MKKQLVKIAAQLAGWKVSGLFGERGDCIYFEHFCFSRSEALAWLACYPATGIWCLCAERAPVLVKLGIVRADFMSRRGM